MQKIFIKMQHFLQKCGIISLREENAAFERMNFNMDNRQENSISFVYCDKSPEMKLISFIDISNDVQIIYEDGEMEYAA